MATSQTLVDPDIVRRIIGEYREMPGLTGERCTISTGCWMRGSTRAEQRPEEPQEEMKS